MGFEIQTNKLFSVLFQYSTGDSKIPGSNSTDWVFNIYLLNNYIYYLKDFQL